MVTKVRLAPKTMRRTRPSPRHLRLQAEAGCSEPVYRGAKAKCLLRVVPRAQEASPLAVDRRCVPRGLGGGATPIEGSYSSSTKKSATRSPS